MLESPPIAPGACKLQSLWPRWRFLLLFLQQSPCPFQCSSLFAQPASSVTAIEQEKRQPELLLLIPQPPQGGAHRSAEEGFSIRPSSVRCFLRLQAANSSLTVATASQRPSKRQRRKLGSISATQKLQRRASARLAGSRCTHLKGQKGGSGFADLCLAQQCRPEPLCLQRMPSMSGQVQATIVLGGFKKQGARCLDLLGPLKLLPKFSCTETGANQEHRHNEGRCLWLSTEGGINTRGHRDRHWAVARWLG